MLQYRVNAIRVVEVSEQLHNIRMDRQPMLQLKLLPHLAVKLILVEHLLVDHLERYSMASLLLDCFEDSSEFAISELLANFEVSDLEWLNPLLLDLIALLAYHLWEVDVFLIYAVLVNLVCLTQGLESQLLMWLFLLQN